MLFLYIEVGTCTVNVKIIEFASYFLIVNDIQFEWKMACIGSDWVRGVGEGVDGSTCDEGEGGHGATCVGWGRGRVMVLPASGDQQLWWCQVGILTFSDSGYIITQSHTYVLTPTHMCDWTVCWAEEHEQLNRWGGRNHISLPAALTGPARPPPPLLPHMRNVWSEQRVQQTSRTCLTFWHPFTTPQPGTGGTVHPYLLI